MQKMIGVYSITLVSIGIIMLVLVQLNKIPDGAYLLLTPMIVTGLWLGAYSKTRRKHGNNR